MFNNPFENATALWELLNAPSLGPDSSRNHIMYGSVGAWFYSHIAGIDLSSNIINIQTRMQSEEKKHLMKKLHCQLSTLHGLIHISYTRDEQDIVPNSIRLRITILWSSDTEIPNHPEFNVEKDSQTGLMIVHISSGRYEFHVLWK